MYTKEPIRVNYNSKLKSSCLILMIAKQLAVTINKNNTTAVSAASKPHSRLLKSKTFISKWMFPASMKKRFNPIAAIE